MKIGEMVTKITVGGVCVGTVTELKREGNVLHYKAKNLRDGYEFEGEIRMGSRSITIVPSLKGVLLAIALVGTSASDSHAIECKTRAEGSGWSWRLIDGKRCWYKGTRKIDKKRLSWAKGKGDGYSAKPRPRIKSFIEESVPVDEPIVPLTLDEPMTFEDRWCALCIRGR